jgi:hypothetical protein
MWDNPYHLIHCEMEVEGRSPERPGADIEKELTSGSYQPIDSEILGKRKA